MKKLRPKTTVKLFTDDKCFGPGVCYLLEEVNKTNSLRQAAQSMGMAYSKAWKIVKHAEEGLNFKLLDSKVGGKAGGGASLTEEAKRLIKDFRNYEKEVSKASSQAFDKYFDWI